MTGALNTAQATRLNKYFLQILAGITNANVVLDPPGVLVPGAVQRIPFVLTEADYGLDVFVLCDTPWAVQFALETPDGTLLTPATGGNVQYVVVGGLAYYRLGLPALPADATGTHGGTWHVLLALGGRYGPFIGVAAQASNPGQLKLPFELVVHIYSNLLFNAYVTQSSYSPGASIGLQATLREYDQPVSQRGRCWDEVTRPDGSSFNLPLAEEEPGRFYGTFTGGLPGLYSARVRATGTSFYGRLFMRELTLSAVIVLGRAGDPNGHPTGGGSNTDPNSQFWCRWLSCALHNGLVSEALIKQWRGQGFDLMALLKCLERTCKDEPCGSIAHVNAGQLLDKIRALLTTDLSNGSSLLP